MCYNGHVRVDRQPGFPLLFRQDGVNEEVTETIREEFRRQGVPFTEIDLTGTELDSDWRGLPAIGGKIGLADGLVSGTPTEIRNYVSLA